MNLTIATAPTVPRTVLHETTRAARRLLATSESFLISVAPHGGQRTARRNALVAVRSDAVAARQRAEALAAIIPVTAQQHPAAG